MSAKSADIPDISFLTSRDDTAVPKLRKYNGIVPLAYDTTDFSRRRIIALILLVVLFLGLIYIMLGPHTW